MFTLNTKVTQLLNIIIEINAASTDNFIKQYSYKSRKIVGI